MFSLSRVIGRFKAKFQTEINYRGLIVPIRGDHIIRPIIDELMGDRYETPEIDALLNLLRPQDIVLEIGVGIGVVSGMAAKRFPEAKITSYEANPDLMDPIRKLHKLNGISSVTLHNRILVPGPSTGSRAFQIHASFAESSLLDTGDTVKTVQVETESLDDVMQALKPDILVVDIEGGEAELLPEANMSALRALVLELHPKVISRAAEKAIYDRCLASGLYPRVDLSTANVVTFERISEA